MSAMIGNPLLLGPEGYQISRSVRLRSSASAYFNRTPGSATNRRTMTLSMWQKRGEFGSTQEPAIMWAGTNSSNYTLFRWGDGVGNSDSKFKLNLNMYTGSTNINLITTPVYRDPSAWYHIVLSIDTTQATAANRVRLYINGTEVTAFSSATYPSQNLDLLFNSTNAHEIGRFNFGSYLDGYLTEINFIDGQALTPSSFGETDILTGVWKPKKYTGTYGTNGFFLNFSDNSSNTATTIGKDYSGNGNNWTPNNISVTAGVTYDSMLDVPTNWADGGNGRGNYCTLNPLNRQTGSSAAVVTNGNLTITVPSGVNATPGAYAVATGTFLLAGGKWYFEAVGQQVSGSGGGHALGVTNALTFNFNGTNYYTSSFSNVSKSASAAADVLMIAYDADNNLAWVGKNGTWDAGNPSAGTGGTSYTGPVIPFAQGYNDTTNRVDVNCNFGQRPFTYTPPTGFRALNTQNLPAPTIVRGNLWMDATLYTGTGATLNVNNAAGFAPDLVWIKSRSDASSHGLHDRVRGEPYAILISNSTAAESTGGSYISSFGGLTSTGFQLNSNTSGNGSGSTYVGWQWRANGTPAVTNTAGSITSTVSASATSGFSVVTYTGTGANATVGHGLGVAPRMIIFKRRSATANWAVYHASIGNTGALALDLTIATDTNVAYFNNTSPTSSVFTVGTGNSVNASTSTYVAYLFAPVAGFSAFGSYTGNGSSDGAFVFTGFRPRYVLIKRSGDGTNNWEVRDSARDTYNAADDRLFPNTSAAEDANNEAVDFLANGFKIRNTGSGSNASSATYIYAAFAEFPFRTALAR